MHVWFKKRTPGELSRKEYVGDFPKESLGGFCKGIHRIILEGIHGMIYKTALSLNSFKLFSF